jgi:YfiH family protein
MVINSKLLSSVDFISHGFFTRKGGFSTGDFESLNTSFLVGDNMDNVKKNRDHVAEYFNLSPNRLATLKQIHSTNVILIDKNTDIQTLKEYEADGLIVKDNNIILGVLTADCMPILFADKEKKIVAAIHCGWKGLVDGIIEITLESLLKNTSSLENILVAIGPCIQQDSYEVDTDFYTKIVNKNNTASTFFKEKKDGKYLFNLPSYAKNILLKCGMLGKNIDVLNYDTYKNEELFFSHRRSTHKNAPTRGLQISCIKINKH